MRKRSETNALLAEHAERESIARQEQGSRNYGAIERTWNAAERKARNDTAQRYVRGQNIRILDGKEAVVVSHDAGRGTLIVKLGRRTMSINPSSVKD